MNCAPDLQRWFGGSNPEALAPRETWPYVSLWYTVPYTFCKSKAELPWGIAKDGAPSSTVSLIDLLDVERQRLQTEQSLAQAQVQLTDDFISLQKALGLGCSVPTISVASE
jgi:hypothetical protein